MSIEVTSETTSASRADLLGDLEDFAMSLHEAFVAGAMRGKTIHTEGFENVPASRWDQLTEKARDLYRVEAQWLFERFEVGRRVP